MSSPKHIVIAGGGFAGVRLARKLRKQKHVVVTLINDTDDFRYSPALYRAATGFKMGMARLPLEWMLLDSSNTTLVVGKVASLDKETKTLRLEDGRKIEYDWAVMALGAVTTYFGIDGLDKHSHGIKTFDEIIELKHHIHDNLVENTLKDEHNFVIVGAGPTGVELAGALGSYLRTVSKRHKLKRNKLQKVRVYLVEAGPRILPQMSEKAAEKVHRRLEKIGIDILTDTMVRSETLHSLKTSNGAIKTQNVIWTAGTTNNPFFKEQKGMFSLDKRGKVHVDKHLQVASDIYVCGDNAATRFSGLAVTAIRHGDFVAKDISARVTRKKRPKFKEKHPMQVVPAGARWAIFQYRKIVLSGWIISWVRRAADIVGYTDVLGPVKALTIWKESDRIEEHCSVCRVR